MCEEKIKSSELKELAAAFLASRALLLLIILASNFLVLEQVPSRNDQLRHASITKQISLSALAQKVLTAADSGWYLEVAINGYAPGPYTSDQAMNWVFFPLYPALIAAFNAIYNAPLFWALLISNCSFFAALYYLLKLAKLQNFSATQSRSLIWLTAFFPCSYFFSLAFTESIFFLLTVLSFYKFKQEKFLHASLCFALATLCRPTGLLLLPAFFLAFYQQNPKIKLAPIATLPLLAIAAFCLYMHHLTGNAFAFIDNQVAWGRSPLGLSLAPLLDVFSKTQIVEPWNFTLLNRLFFILAIAASLHYIAKRNFTYALILILPPLITILSATDLSLTRIIAVLFPLHLFIAQKAEGIAQPLMLVTFAAIYTLLSLMYALGISPALT